VDIQHYKARLLALEQDMSIRTLRETALGRDQTADSPRDSGEASVADEAASLEFASAERTSTILTQVRDALLRIADGTFGTCIVDGEPIEHKRLEALPWTQYCLKHQALLDDKGARTMPTL
jgi:DnaK suppressor protein